MLRAVVRREVDHHAAALHAGRRHVLDTQPLRALVRAERGHEPVVAVGDRADDVRIGTEAVVIDVFRLAVAVHVEHLPDMREAVPLRRVLQRQQHLIVADDIERGRIVATQGIVHVRPAVALRGTQFGRRAARVEHRSARIIERQRQAEGASLPHLRDAAQHRLARQQVGAAELVVLAPVAPGRALRAARPALHAATCSAVNTSPATVVRRRSRT